MKTTQNGCHVQVLLILALSLGMGIPLVDAVSLMGKCRIFHSQPITPQAKPFQTLKSHQRLYKRGRGIPPSSRYIEVVEDLSTPSREPSPPIPLEELEVKENTHGKDMDPERDPNQQQGYSDQDNIPQVSKTIDSTEKTSPKSTSDDKRRISLGLFMKFFKQVQTFWKSLQSWLTRSKPKKVRRVRKLDGVLRLSLDA